MRVSDAWRIDIPPEEASLEIEDSESAKAVAIAIGIMAAFASVQIQSLCGPAFIYLVDKSPLVRSRQRNSYLVWSCLTYLVWRTFSTRLQSIYLT